MGDNLPLIPDKDGAVCADVRTVLREVFRDLDYVTPHTNKSNGENKDELKTEHVSPTKSTKWDEDISSEFKKLYQQEVKLQEEYVKRLARDALPNIYKLRSPVTSLADSWKHEIGLLARRDLKPSLEQSANCEDSLWVKNILNRSSGDVTVLERTASSMLSNEHLQLNDSGTLQSMSIGDVIPRPVPRPQFSSLPPALPEHIISIPSKLDFINFKVGQLYTQSLRLVNISKFEIRISVRPPSRRELDVELCSRLVVTSGSVAEMKIHYRPNDVRALTDQLQIRVSSGRTLRIPVACFMEPPLLEILSNASCSSSVSYPLETVNDVLDLGAKLLGDVHRAQLQLRCGAKHASFFLLSEDSWIDSSIQFTVDQSEDINKYGIAVDSFFVTPVRWSGGDAVSGVAVCRAATTGLHTTVLRIISSTAIVRQLNLVADTMLYSPKHITFQAHVKDYDICSEDDPACEYNVNLGIAFPHRSLSATINVVNHSPLYYTYYWKERPWGVCCCWNNLEKIIDNINSDDLCSGAKEAKLKSEKDNGTIQQSSEKELKSVVLDKPSGCILPRSVVQVVVSVPDVGCQLGGRRAALMLILSEIPKESITREYESSILSYNFVEEKAIPGISTSWSRETCEVVCAQMEVWWEVAPVSFTLEPSFIRLPHSRRVKMIVTQLHATQLSGVSSITAKWEMLTKQPSTTLSPTRPILTTLLLPLLSDKSSHVDVIRLTSQDKEYSASTVIEQYCDSRHLSIAPTFIWLGLVPPGVTVSAKLTVHNDTYEDINWSATCCRWWGERGVAEACRDRLPCTTCNSRACTCSLLTPTSGSLKHSEQEDLFYSVTAPDSDACVATLVQVRRAGTSGAAGVQARAALIGYRVLAPRLVLRVFPCYGDKRRECEGCALDTGPGSSPRGSAVLRPSTALTLGDSSCCRLRITNITPLQTRVTWEPAIDGDDVVGVKFLPNEFKIKGHSEVDIMVILEAKRVCHRRLFIRKANLEHTQKPLYLVIDAAVSGVEVIFEVPIGDKLTLFFPSIKLTQKEKLKRDETEEKRRTSDEIFTYYDLKREQQRENICRCKFEMKYIPPERKREPPADAEESPSIEIIEEPPPLVHVCACANCQKPVLPDVSDPYCLQFKQIPLRSVTSRTVVLRNVSRIDTCWTAVVRRWPRRHTRTINKDQWAGDVRYPGVVLQCEPASGELRASSKTIIRVSVYADCWGFYYDQILIQVENLEPLMLDVWIEAVGVPLEFARRPYDPCTLTTLWLSTTDPERCLVVKNTCRADLVVYGYVLKENEHPQDVLPFRLYIRLFDVPRRECPCVATLSSDNSSECESLLGEMDTGVELYLSPDYGIQNEDLYQVEPLECRFIAFENVNYKVRLLAQSESAVPSRLALRTLFVQEIGNYWCRPAPPHQFVQLRQAQRTSCLQASTSELQVTLCALDLPCGDTIRVRKRFQLQNVGDGQLDLYAEAEFPWTVDVTRQICAAHCISERADELNRLKYSLPARSSTEMVAEVSIKTKEVWPAENVKYSTRSVSTSVIHFYELENIEILAIPLILEIEFPVVTTEPAVINFGDVSDDSTRKAYITVSNSSPITTLNLIASWMGDEQFRVWPLNLTLRPGGSERLYIEYTARWLSGASTGGSISVAACGAAGRWCAATARVAARAVRCGARCAQAHVDYTDDTHLIPSDVLSDVLGNI